MRTGKTDKANQVLHADKDAGQPVSTTMVTTNKRQQSPLPVDYH